MLRNEVDLAESETLTGSEVEKPRLALNYVLLSGGELVAKVLGALAFAYLARVLGPQVY